MMTHKKKKITPEPKNKPERKFILTSPQFLQWCLLRRSVKGSLHEQQLSISESGIHVGGAKYKNCFENFEKL